MTEAVDRSGGEGVPQGMKVQQGLKSHVQQQLRMMVNPSLEGT